MKSKLQEGVELKRVKAYEIKITGQIASRARRRMQPMVESKCKAQKDGFSNGDVRTDGRNESERGKQQEAR